MIPSASFLLRFVVIGAFSAMVMTTMTDSPFASAAMDKEFDKLFPTKLLRGISSTPPPSESPPFLPRPSNFKKAAPTCQESYLDSVSLNIGLVIDLSHSMYEKTLSSEVDIGDVNGDGKGNTILDFQILAIQDLLESIVESVTLNNTNTEIGLIGFETDAYNHGVWQPLNDAGDSYNEDLMEYIKNELRAPIINKDVNEVYALNNGYTNFDAALDRAVEYFRDDATPDRLNLMVFLTDGEPNIRGDGDAEEYCTDATSFWNDTNRDAVYRCSDLNLKPGEPHKICRGNDPDCIPMEPYQDCVRGPNHCFLSDAVQQYDSELNALDEMKVARLAIGVGEESNVTEGSALWMIDNNPGKDLGILPEQVTKFKQLSDALKNLCILNTDPPTVSPLPTDSPSVTPSMLPRDECSDDAVIVKRVDGVTECPTRTPPVTIVDVDDESSVTVALHQVWEPSSSKKIGHIFATYKDSDFSQVCIEDQNVAGGSMVFDHTFTIKCNVITPNTLLMICVADDFANNILAAGDDAEIPKCCHPEIPEGFGIVCYQLEINCSSECFYGKQER